MFSTLLLEGKGKEVFKPLWPLVLTSSLIYKFQDANMLVRFEILSV